MEKLLKIECCANCIHRQTYKTVSNSLQPMCDNISRPIENVLEMPEWCPLINANDLIIWKKANDPPKSKERCIWGTEVLAITNYRNVYKLAYFTGNDGGGVWQRQGRFEKNEIVELWTEIPKLES